MNSPNDDDDDRDDGPSAPTLAPLLEVGPAPAQVAELAEGCRRFVKGAIGLDLDYEPDTLSLLDHYIDQARSAVAMRPEALGVLAQAVGCYFGEVVRRRHPSWWQTDGDDPAYWQLQFETVYLAFSPVALAYEALFLKPMSAPEGDDEEGASATEGAGGDEGDAFMSQLELEEEDRVAVERRLSDLPAVSEAEFYAPTTRLEVIDIAVDAIRARHAASDEDDPRLTPDDYEGFPLPN